MSWIGAKKEALFNWIDERTAISTLWSSLMDEEIPGGARWEYVFGSGLLFVFATQVLTGILLLFYYVPSTDHAHTSVAYIQKEVFLGSYIRGFHYYGANTMLILLVLHFLQTFLWGAYKKKRELLWIVGLLLFLLILGFLFTGYLLPWDQKAYFGTKVGLGVMSGVPVVGSLLERILMGGSSLSTLTLSRFFVVHVFILPATVILFILAHLALLRKAKPAGPYTEVKPGHFENFYPAQFFKDTVFTLIIFAILGYLSHKIPVPLGPQADPSDSDYVARPEWYFLALFQLLKYFPGKLVLIPSLILPGLATTALMLLPFADKKAERNPFKRPIATAMVFCSLLGLVSLTLLARWEDQKDPVIKARLEQQVKEEEKFLKEPFKPQQIGLKPVTLQPSAPPPDVYAANCAVCHGDNGDGDIGPSLHSLSKKPQRTREDIIRLLKSPTSYGLDSQMPAFTDLSDEEYKAISEWISNLK